jgi:hypothetical protein
MVFEEHIDNRSQTKTALGCMVSLSGPPWAWLPRNSLTGLTVLWHCRRAEFALTSHHTVSGMTFFTPRILLNALLKIPVLPTAF